jgi:NAD(P)-dependent dehydrogenase (short-subunit alcohol dehydrogenase family)
MAHQKESAMLLQDRVAVIYGAGGAIGGAVARAFGREGARLFLTGRSLAPVEAVAAEVVAAGGSAEAAELDALDEEAVDGHLQSVVDEAGRVDVSFNAIGLPPATYLGVPLVELPAAQLAVPIAAYTTSYFLTARLAARRMIPNRSGVIMTVSALPARRGTPQNGGYGAAQAAKEALTRDLSVELAPHGIRVVGLRSHGLPETSTMREVFDAKPSSGLTFEGFRDALVATTHPRRVLAVDELADVAALTASDRASAMTGTIVNLTMGALDD